MNDSGKTENKQRHTNAAIVSLVKFFAKSSTSLLIVSRKFACPKMGRHNGSRDPTLSSSPSSPSPFANYSSSSLSSRTGSGSDVDWSFSSGESEPCRGASLKFPVSFASSSSTSIEPPMASMTHLGIDALRTLKNEA